MPNKATSKSQWRFMKGVAEGTIKPTKGLTKEKAAEFIGKQDPSNLPEKVIHKRAKKRLKKVFG